MKLDLSWCEEVKSLEVESERVHDKNLKKFIKTSLFLNEIPYDNSNKIYLLFLEEINAYQILICNQNFESIYLECLQKSEIIKSDEIILFYHKKYFVIYKGVELYYFQCVKYDFTILELKDYINNRLKIIIDKFQKIDDFDLNLLIKRFENSKKRVNLINYNKQKNNFFKWYFVYLLSLIVCVVCYIQLNKIKPKIEKVESIKYEVFKSFFDNYKNIADNIIKDKIKLHSLIYEKNTIKLSLNAKNKNQIYNFLLKYKEKILNQNITYIEDKNSFICEIEMKI